MPNASNISNSAGEVPLERGASSTVAFSSVANASGPHNASNETTAERHSDDWEDEDLEKELDNLTANDFENASNRTDAGSEVMSTAHVESIENHSLDFNLSMRGEADSGNIAEDDEDHWSLIASNSTANASEAAGLVSAANESDSDLASESPVDPSFENASNNSLLELSMDFDHAEGLENHTADLDVKADNDSFDLNQSALANVSSEATHQEDIDIGLNGSRIRSDDDELVGHAENRGNSSNLNASIEDRPDNQSMFVAANSSLASNYSDEGLLPDTGEFEDDTGFDPNDSSADLNFSNFTAWPPWPPRGVWSGNTSSNPALQFEWDESANESNETIWFTGQQHGLAEVNASVEDKSDNASLVVSGGNWIVFANRSDKDVLENASYDVQNISENSNQSFVDKSDHQSFADFVAENQSLPTNATFTSNYADGKLTTNGSDMGDARFDANGSSTEMDVNGSENASNETDVWIEGELVDDEGDNRSEDLNGSAVDKSDNVSSTAILVENETLLVNSSIAPNHANGTFLEGSESGANVSVMGLDVNDSSGFDLNTSGNGSNGTGWFGVDKIDMDQGEIAENGTGFNESSFDKSDNDSFADTAAANQSLLVDNHTNGKLTTNGSDMEDLRFDSNDSSTEMDVNGSENASNETDVWIEGELVDDEGDNRSEDLNGSAVDKSDNVSSTAILVENETLLVNSSFAPSHANGTFLEGSESGANVSVMGLDVNDSSGFDLNTSGNGSNGTGLFGMEKIDMDQGEVAENGTGFNESSFDKSDNDSFADTAAANQSLLVDNDTDGKLTTNGRDMEDLRFDSNDSSTEMDVNGSENASNETDVWIEGELVDDEGDNRSEDLNGSAVDKSDNVSSTAILVENETLLVNSSFALNYSDGNFLEGNESGTNLSYMGVDVNDSSEFDLNTSGKSSNGTGWFGVDKIGMDQAEIAENGTGFNESLSDKSDNESFADTAAVNQSLLVDNHSDGKLTTNGSDMEDMRFDSNDSSTEMDVNGSENASNETDVWIEGELVDDEGDNRSEDLNESAVDKSDNVSSTAILVENETLLVNSSFALNYSDGNFLEGNESRTNWSDMGQDVNDSSGFDLNTSGNVSNGTGWFGMEKIDMDQGEVAENGTGFNESSSDKSDNESFADTAAVNQSLLVDNYSDGKLTTNGSDMEDLKFDSNDSSTEMDVNGYENASNETDVWIEGELVDDDGDNRSEDLNESAVDKSDNVSSTAILVENETLPVNSSFALNYSTENGTGFNESSSDKSDNESFADTAAVNQSLLVDNYSDGKLTTNGSDMEDMRFDSNDSSTEMDVNGSENASNETDVWIEGELVDDEGDNRSEDLNESAVDKSDNVSSTAILVENETLLVNSSFALNYSDGNFLEGNESRTNWSDMGQDVNDSSGFDLNTSGNGSNGTGWFGMEKIDMDQGEVAENGTGFNESSSDKSDNESFADTAAVNQSLLVDNYSDGKLTTNGSDMEDLRFDSNDSSTEMDVNGSENASNETDVWIEGELVDDEGDNRSEDLNESAVDKSDNVSSTAILVENETLLVNSSFALNYSDGNFLEGNESGTNWSDMGLDVNDSSSSGFDLNTSGNGSNWTEVGFDAVDDGVVEVFINQSMNGSLAVQSDNESLSELNGSSEDPDGNASDQSTGNNTLNETETLAEVGRAWPNCF